MTAAPEVPRTLRLGENDELRFAALRFERLEEVDGGRGRAARAEDRPYADLLQRRDILLRDDAAGPDHHVVYAARA